MNMYQRVVANGGALMGGAKRKAPKRKAAKKKRGGVLLGGKKPKVVAGFKVVRVGGAKKKAGAAKTKSNPWITHVKKYAKAHKVSYGEAMSLARSTYK